MTDALVEHYRANGYAIARDVLNADELRALRDRTAAIVAGRCHFPADKIELEPHARDSGDKPLARKLNDCADHDSVYYQHACNEKILSVVEALLGSDIKLFGSQAFLKPPGGVEKPYHQDSAYFTVEPMAMVTCWTALDDVTVDNGCMWVIPGSHQRGIVDHGEPWMVGERLDQRVPESQMDRRDETPLTLSAGSCSFHHSLLLHSSRPNRTAQPRRGLAVHYMSARSHWTGPEKSKPEFVLLRGKSFYGCV